MIKNLLVLLSIGWFSIQVNAQVIINEVCSANGTIVADFEGDFKDWLEIYNPTSNPISLKGYYFETFDTKQKRWVFPDVTIKPDSCMLIFCSSKNRKAVIDHLEIPIFPGTLWRYQLGTVEPDPTWTNPGFDDSGWLSGATSIGYGDGDDITVIGPTTSLFMRDTFSLPSTENFLIAYLAMDYDDAFVAYINGIEVARNNIWNIGRPPFDAFASEEHEATVYSCATPGFLDCTEFFYVDEELLQEVIVVGENVLSIQIHNFDLGMDDMTAYCLPILGVSGPDTTFNYFPQNNNLHTNFNLSSNGQRISLKDSNDIVMDEYIVGNVHYNHSRGRYPDGTDNWCLSDTPSPCGPNSSDCNTGYAEAPIVEVESGFYSSGLSVEISSPVIGETIRFTTDGSAPTLISTLYTGTLTINQNSTIRAQVFSSNADLLPSDIVTKTYIIDDSSTLPIIFITTDSLYLFDTLTGIYVIGPNTDTSMEAFPYWGTANYYQDVDVPGHVEYLDANQQKQMGQDCSIKIHGNFSRGWAQKSFRFIANDKYGDGWFNFSPFSGKSELKKFKSFNVRNAGVDYNTTHCRDGLMNRAARNLNLEYMDHQPCLVYINGEYWGVYGLRERQDEKYLATNFDINGDFIDLLRFSGDEFQGSNENYIEMVNYIVDNDMSIDSNYSRASSMLDIENFCDYMTTETYYGNFDWISEGGNTNNIKFWRSTEPESKWRYILWDTDLGLELSKGFGPGTGVEFDYLSEILGPTYSDPHSRMLLNLLDNTEFHDYFINRYADLINTTFSPTTFGGVAQTIYNELAPEMERHFNKWGAPDVTVFGSLTIARSSNVSEWSSEFDSIIDFIDNRPFYARNNIETLFALTKQVDVTLDVNPAGAGQIKINTVTPDAYPWTGVYYDGVPVTITVLPNSGYNFVNWTANNAFVSDSSTSITLNISSDDEFIANFEVIDYNVFAYPNPFNNEITIEFHMVEEGQASIKLYDMSGRLAATIIDYGSFQSEGVNKITVNLDNYGLRSGAYVLGFKTGDIEQTIKLIKY